jgi:hypothetical protein
VPAVADGDCVENGDAIAELDETLAGQPGQFNGQRTLVGQAARASSQGPFSGGEVPRCSPEFRSERNPIGWVRQRRCREVKAGKLTSGWTVDPEFDEGFFRGTRI